MSDGVSTLYDVDVHIITLDGWGGQKKEWFDQCISSLKNEEANVHIVEGTKGHIGQGRSKGFEQGNAKYVSFVDPDDWVEPEIFEGCAAYLNTFEDIDVLCTKENVVDEKGNFLHINGHPEDRKIDSGSPYFIHHLVVMRREVVEPYLHYLKTKPIRCEQLLWLNLWADGKKFKFVDRIGYNWRIHEESSHKLLKPEKKDMEEMRELYNRIKND